MPNHNCESSEPHLPRLAYGKVYCGKLYSSEDHKITLKPYPSQIEEGCGHIATMKIVAMAECWHDQLDQYSSLTVLITMEYPIHHSIFQHLTALWNNCVPQQQLMVAAWPHHSHSVNGVAFKTSIFYVSCMNWHKTTKSSLSLAWELISLYIVPIQDWAHHNAYQMLMCMAQYILTLFHEGYHKNCFATAMLIAITTWQNAEGFVNPFNKVFACVGAHTFL